jgi:methylenetetrahydrofolate reductase (NADPH)
MTDVRSPERSSAARPSLVEALDRPRYEILPLAGIADEVLEHLPAGRKITLTSSPTRGLESTLSLAEQLAPLGYEVVPHLAARLIADRAHLEEVVLRLRNAGVREAFVIAGDARQAAGEFEGAAELLSTMAGLRERFSEVGISGYPESHHLISDETTIEAMFEKEPMATYIVSQICFDAEVIRTWIRRVRERGTSLPIWIGVPGAVETRKLLRTSLRIGLGQSARFLRGQRGVLRRFLRTRTYTPTELLVALAPSFADPAAKVGGVHVYTFNELKKTETWRRQLVDRLNNQEETPWHR